MRKSRGDRKRPTHHEISEMIRLAKNGKSAGFIHRKTGWSVPTVRRVCRKFLRRDEVRLRADHWLHEPDVRPRALMPETEIAEIYKRIGNYQDDPEAVRDARRFRPIKAPMLTPQGLYSCSLDERDPQDALGRMKKKVTDGNA